MPKVKDIGEVSLIFEPQEVFAHPQAQESLLSTAHRVGVKINSCCGGRGICKSCVIRYVEGEVPPPSAQDNHFFSRTKLAKGWRRACQTVPQHSARINVPKRTRSQASRLFVGGEDIWVHPEPLTKSVELLLAEPSFEDHTSDAQRLIEAANNVADGICEFVDLSVLQILPIFVRQQNRQVQAIIREKKIIALLPIKTHTLGLAIDLGTTNIALLLVDLHTGSTLGSCGIENQQCKYGADVIARISHAKGKPEVLLSMQQVVVAAINQAAHELCAEHALDPGAIVDMVVAGNTVMHHFLLGLPVDQLGVAPFTAVTRTTEDLTAKQLGFDIAPAAGVHVMHNIAGFVGGDHSALLLGIRADQEQRTVIALDIGTNTEISLIHKGQIYCLSSPSGPALEGGNIHCGMRAAEGAIESVSVSGETVQLQTIDGADPIGICGSAVLDIAAEFYKAGAINFRGQINEASSFAVQRDGMAELRLSKAEPELVFTQADVRNLQLAKGAIRAGIELLLQQAGLEAQMLDRIIIAGAFGMYIRPESAIAIGMLPNLPITSIEQVGNAAGIGVKLALLSEPMRETAKRLAANSIYFEQAGNKSFMKSFIRQLNFPVLVEGRQR